MRIPVFCFALSLASYIGFSFMMSRPAHATITKAATLTQLAQITLTTAGTRQQIAATDTYCTCAVINALAGNTGVIYLGDSAVSSTNGLTLQKGDTVSICAPDKLIQVNLISLYFDAATSADKIKVSCSMYANVAIFPKGV